MAKLSQRLRNDISKEMRKANVIIDSGTDADLAALPNLLVLQAARIITRLAEADAPAAPTEPV